LRKQGLDCVSGLPQSAVEAMTRLSNGDKSPH
jgi:hypothetical protein